VSGVFEVLRGLTECCHLIGRGVMHCSRNLVTFLRNLLYSPLFEMKYIFPNRRQISTSLHGATFKNTVILTPINMSNLIEEEHNVLITTARGFGYFTFKLFILYIIYKDFCVLLCHDLLCVGR